MLEKRPVAKHGGLDRRRFLAAGAVATAIAVSGHALINASEAWGLEVGNLKPETMRTLIQLARDIYPHDRLADKYYAVAMKSYDTGAGADPALKSLVETGVANLDDLAKGSHGVAYANVGWEQQRVDLLHEIETGAFFQKIRSGLVVGLYNNQDVWPLFGYEGESAAHGGYIHRGFNDLTWL